MDVWYLDCARSDVLIRPSAVVYKLYSVLRPSCTTIEGRIETSESTQRTSDALYRNTYTLYFTLTSCLFNKCLSKFSLRMNLTSHT